MGNADPALTFLKDIGYSVVRLPRTDIRPLQVLVQEGSRLTRLGEMQTVLQPGTSIKAPLLAENAAAPGIAGQRTRDLSFGVGLSILGNIIGAMGGSKLGLDVSYKSAKTVVFEFADVLVDSVELVDIDQYLTDADISPFSTHVAKLLEADAIFVTTSTIKTKKLLVEAKAKNGTTVDVSIPEIQGVVGGNVKVGTAGEFRSKVAYEGAVPVVFGFQAARLFYEEGRYTAFKSLRPGDAGLESVPAERPAGEWLRTGSPFVRLDAV